MNPTLSWGANALRRLRALRSQSGAFDLPSILVGVVVVGILTAGVLAAIFGVIPFAQDNAAKQDLDSVRTAEGVAKARDSGYKNKAGLLTGGLINDKATLGVGTDANGSCYVGISKSATGTVFYNSDRTTQPVPLTDGVDPGCIDAATLDEILDGIGGFAPGPVAGGPTDTDGDGTPDSEDPTPGGGSGSGGVLAADTWSAQRTITNLYPDPGFKNGISGWTGDNIYRDYVDNAATTVSSEGSGYNGDSGALRITATGSAGRDRTTAYFPIDAVNVKNFSFQIATPDGTWAPTASWYAGVVFTDPSTGAVIGSGGNSNATRAGGLGANVWERYEYSNNFSAPSQPHNTYLYIQADHVPAGVTVSMLVDRIFVSDACAWDCAAPSSPSVTGYERNFDGSYPASSDWTYSWTGAENASPSKAVSPKGIAAPATAMAGDTIQIKGTGFAPNSTVTPAIFFGWGPGGDEKDFNAAPVQTDASGNFDTTVLIPANTQPWNWGIGVVEDISYPKVVRMDINAAPGTGAAAATPPGPWSDLVEGTTEQFSAPAVVTLDSDFIVMGKGYAPFTRVDLWDDTWSLYASGYTDNNGFFLATVNIPSGDAVPGPGVITAYGDEELRLDVTFK